MKKISIQQILINQLVSSHSLKKFISKMSYQNISKCQAQTQKGNPCKRNALKCSQFCYQHQTSKSQIPEFEQLFTSNVVHGCRSHQFKHKNIKKHLKYECCFINTCGDYVCKNVRFSVLFCEQHKKQSDKFAKTINEYDKEMNKIRNEPIINFEKLIDFSINFYTFLISNKHSLVHLHRKEKLNDWIELFKIIKKNRDTPTSRYLMKPSVLKKFDILMNMESEINALDVDKQIKFAKQNIKKESIKLNMLSEIYIKDPQPQSTQLQSVFNNDINSKILSFLI